MTHSIKHALVAAAVIAAAAITTAGAQGPAPKYKRDLPAKLLKEAKISEAHAARAASAKVPNGTIEGVELENENGRLIYSYELKVPGKSGVEEVNVNAKTGAIVNTEHESAAAERAESKSEKAEKPTKKPPR